MEVAAMFANDPPIPLRPEVQRFLQASEHLLAIFATPHKKLSEDDRRLVEYYITDLTKALGSEQNGRGVSVGKPLSR